MKLKAIGLEIRSPEQNTYFSSRLPFEQLSGFYQKTAIALLEEADFFNLPLKIDSTGSPIQICLTAETENKRASIHFSGEPTSPNLDLLFKFYREVWARTSPVLYVLNF